MEDFNSQTGQRNRKEIRTLGPYTACGKQMKKFETRSDSVKKIIWK